MTMQLKRVDFGWHGGNSVTCHSRNNRRNGTAGVLSGQFAWLLPAIIVSVRSLVLHDILGF
jgi:hypothetical protein